MFNLYQSNKTEELLRELVRQLAQHPADPFVADTILVQNPGLAHWLKMQLASEFGIAANIEFPLPSRFLWQVQRQLLPALADDSVFAKDSLTWLIYQLLPAVAAEASFEPIRRYIQAKAPLQIYQLAAQIADMYDQYLVYRPDWILDWERGGNSGVNTDIQAWQPLLWRAVCAKIQQMGKPLCHRAHSLQHFQQALSGRGADLQLPQRLFIFGFSAMPKDMLDTFVLLSAHTDIHCLTPNPSYHYWADLMDDKRQARLRLHGENTDLMDVGNPLLAGFGRMGQEYQQILLAHNQIHDKEKFVDPGQDSLLQALQQDIYELHGGTDSRAVHADNSIRIMACHSPVREIEVLHDQLLALLEADPKLNVQDIVVMIPDVASYAPYIDAVFNSAAVPLPYSIADRPAAAEHPLLSAFQFLLGLPQSRFSFSELFAFVETQAVAEQFKLSMEDINRLKIWCQQAGIRWGINASHKETLQLPPIAANTWQQGFARLLAGYASSNTHAVLGVSPVGSVEGLQAQAIGKLMEICDLLSGFLQAMHSPRSSAGWLAFLHDLKNTFFKFSSEDSGADEAILRAMQSFAQGVERIELQMEIPFSLLAHYCQQQLEQSSGSQHFMVGKVNFCTLLPMRSIPFKVVCILGLNDADYPRQSQPLGFDLMQYQRRLGDRSRREEDRYLFLEAILSARQHLLLSYRGFDQKTNESKTPSVVLAELMDYLQTAYHINTPGDLLIHIFQQHKLQPFNTEYFQAGNDLFSYNQQWMQANTPLSSNSVLPLFSAPLEISLDELIYFYKNAPKAYLRQQLDIQLYQTEQQEEDDEPFALDGLQRYQLKDALLQEFDDAIFSSLLNSGHLPVQGIGEKVLEKIREDISPLREIAKKLRQMPRIKKKTLRHISPSGLQLHAWFDDVYAQGQILVFSGNAKGKRYIEAYLKHLCINTQQSMDTLAHYEDASFQFPALEVNAAQQIFNNWLQVYQRGMCSALPIMADSFWKLIDAREKDPQRSAEKQFMGSHGSYQNIAGDKDDLHMQRCFGQLSALPEQLIALAAELGPVVMDEVAR